jgi:3'-phosphoadenosine 5'-phosphosulfate sulfotransferase (PAPS reductase)/FAD synthetase
MSHHPCSPALNADSGRPACVVTPNPRTYDRVVVAFSGGKDSLAALLRILDLGVCPSRIELHHHAVDGQGPVLMDWPITPAYVAALARHFGLPLYTSWREGGFRREMARDHAPTAPVVFELPDGRLGRAGGSGPPGVRGRFPQVSADLSVRWCSPALKIDVLAAAIRNQPRFDQGRTLVVTGERAAESVARARYRPFEPHRTHCGGRHVDHWRPVLGWGETEVWDRIAAATVRPHPAYGLGWSRLSCRGGIFGSPNQWATLRALYPDVFGEIAAIGGGFGQDHPARDHRDGPGGPGRSLSRRPGRPGPGRPGRRNAVVPAGDSGSVGPARRRLRRDGGTELKGKERDRAGEPAGEWSPGRRRSWPCHLP